MSGRKETVVEVIKSLRRELALDADGVEEYVNRFSCAWRRANHRFSVKLAETRSAMTSAKTSDVVRKMVSPLFITVSGLINDVIARVKIGI